MMAPRSATAESTRPRIEGEREAQVLGGRADGLRTAEQVVLGQPAGEVGRARELLDAVVDVERVDERANGLEVAGGGIRHDTSIWP